MATHEQLTESQESSRPVEVYEITLGSTVYRYTSAEDDLSIGGNAYTAIPIKRGKTLIGGSQSRFSLQVTVPASNPFVQLYLDSLPGSRASLSIYGYQRDETPSWNTAVLIFTGKVQSIRFANNGYQAEIAVKSIEAALNRKMPRLTFGGMCGHLLYSADCGSNPASHNHIGTVTAVSSTADEITVSGLSASGIDAVGGFARPAGENDFRLVLAQSGDVITVLLPFQSNPLGANLQVYAGCDHLVDGDCALVHDRVADFGGWPFVPNRNPFSSGLD